MLAHSKQKLRKDYASWKIKQGKQMHKTTSEQKMLKVAINGFGRIGRLLYRALIERDVPMNIVAVHDLYDIDMARHLLTYDSQYGTWNRAVKIRDNNLLVDDQVTVFLQSLNARDLPWHKYDVDVVVEATGRMKTKQDLAVHLQQGAKRVLLTTGGVNMDRTVIFGVNHGDIESTDRLISAASCTSNCLISLMWILNNEYGLKWANFLTVHAQTPDQNLLDSAHRDYYRTRTASCSIIPTSTHATDVAKSFFLDIMVEGSCVRVPVASVSMLHLVAKLKHKTSLKEVQNFIINQCSGRMEDVIGYTNDPLVSIDVKGSDLSALVSLPNLKYDPEINNLSLLAWYDNEWGYVQRLVDILFSLF